jgi:hypothetical protein
MGVAAVSESQVSAASAGSLQYYSTSTSNAEAKKAVCWSRTTV